MTGPDSRPLHRRAQAIEVEGTLETLRRSFEEFLALPTVIVVSFLAAAVTLVTVEHTEPAWVRPLREFLLTRVFGDSQTTADLMGTIAGGLITVATVTVTLLLVAIQQNAAQLSTEVFDQFLRRKNNQFYFGFFVGLALFALIVLATINESFNPVLSAAVAILLTMTALYLLIVLLYTAINQMRPAEIIKVIHVQTLRARERQLDFLARTRRNPHGSRSVVVEALAPRHGYVTRIDLDMLEKSLNSAAGDAEITLDVSFGTFVSTGDVVARAGAERREDAEALASGVERAIRLERQRDFATDPGDGIEELGTIAWTSISTSKSNPAPGLDAIRILRDLLAHWSDGHRAVPPGVAAGAQAEATLPPPLPIVYRDTVLPELMNTLESLAVVSSESMQHQAFTEVVRTFAVLYGRLPSDQRPRAEDVIRRMLSAMGDHVLTSEMELSLIHLTRSLADAGRPEVAATVDRAREQLQGTVGHLHSRSTRA